MIVKQVSIVTVFTALNLVATLANQLALAYLFGTGAGMDAFLACGAVPWVVLNLAIGDLGYVLVPLLSRCETDGAVEKAQNATFSAVILLSIAVTAFGIAEHRSILRWTTAPNMPVQTFELAAAIAPIMWIVIGLTIIGSYLTGVQYYRRQFAMPSMTLALPYLGMIAGGFIGSRRMGIAAVAIGWVAGTLMRDVLLFVTIKGARIRMEFELLHPACRQLFRTLPMLGASLLPFTALQMIDVYWASRLPVGSISYLGYSNRIVIALASIVVQGISVVLFPVLTEHIARGEMDIFRAKVVEAMKAIFLVIVPILMVVAVARLPIVQIVLQRGKFSEGSAIGVSRVLPFYLFGGIGMAMMNIVIRSFYALQNYKAPALIGVLGLVAYTLMIGAFIGHFSYLAVGIAYAVFWTAMFLVQTIVLGNSTGRLLDHHFAVYVAKVAAASAAAIFAVVSISKIAGLPFNRGGIAIAQGASAMALFVLIGIYLFRFPQCAMLKAAIRSKGGANLP